MSVEPKEQHKVVLDTLIEQKVKGELVNKGKALAKAGYSKSIQHNPKAVLETKGFQQLLQDRIADVTLVDYLAADLQEKEGNRLGELKLAFELKGMLSNKLDITTHQEVDEQLDVMKTIIDKAKDE